MLKDILHFQFPSEMFSHDIESEETYETKLWQGFKLHYFETATCMYVFATPPENDTVLAYQVSQALVPYSESVIAPRVTVNSEYSPEIRFQPYTTSFQLDVPTLEGTHNFLFELFRVKKPLLHQFHSNAEKKSTDKYSGENGKLGFNYLFDYKPESGPLKIHQGILHLVEPPYLYTLTFPYTRKSAPWDYLSSILQDKPTSQVLKEVFEKQLMFEYSVTRLK